MSMTSRAAGGGVFLWVAPEPSASREILAATAQEFDLRMRFCSPAKLRDVVAQQSCALVGIELASPPDESLALVRELRERIPLLPVLTASADPDVTTIRSALGAGASDFLFLPLNRQELHKTLIKVTQTRAEPGLLVAGSAAGEVITVYGARGGLGATTVAVNLAVRIAALTGAHVAVVDLDLQRGDVAAFLNLSPAESLAAFAAAPGGVDELFLQHTLSHHPSGLYVLPAPAQIEEAELVTREHVEVALRLLRSRFRYVVIDTARTLTEATLAAFEHSERLLVLTDRSVPGLRATRRTFELLSRLDTPIKRADVLVTEAVRGSVPMREAVSAIGKQPLLSIPHDEGTAIQAMNAGAPLNGVRDSVLGSAITELASQLTGIPAHPEAGRTQILRRIFGRRKGATT